MGSVSTALGLALKALRLPQAIRRKKGTLLVIGQSTEQGPIPRSEYASYPGAFESQRNPGMFVPRGLIPVVNRGGWWASFYDNMWDWGYDFDIVNAAIGGVSLLNHICGFAGARLDNTIYYQRREGSSCNWPDRGDFGDIFSINHPYTGSARYFNVTVGAKRNLRNSGAFPSVSGTSTWQDFIAYEQGNPPKSALSAPAIGARFVGGIASGVLTVSSFTGGKPLTVGDQIFSGTALKGSVSSLGTGAGGTGTYNLSASTDTASSTLDSYIGMGATLVDGGLTVKRIDETRYGSSGTFLPGDAGGATNFSLGGVMGEQNAGFGYDPLSYIDDAYRAGAAATQSELRIVWFSQGQSDLGAGSVSYQRALMILANFFLRRGWIVVLGNTPYSPAAAASTAANYQAHVDGVDAAVAELAAIYPGKVKRGANLYAALGSTGNMGGQKCTGGTGGVLSTTLTVSSVQGASGSGIAVGQNVWTGTTLVGVVQALGTGTGLTGTYILDRQANVAAGTSLVCAGPGLQFDGVHQAGRMAAPGGTAIANSFKAFLPKLAVLA